MPAKLRGKVAQTSSQNKESPTRRAWLFTSLPWIQEHTEQIATRTLGNTHAHFCKTFEELLAAILILSSVDINRREAVPFQNADRLLCRYAIERMDPLVTRSASDCAE